MRRGEHLGNFLAHGSQLVDGEEATVVDLLARRAERGEAVRLRVQQPVERVEAVHLRLWIAGIAVEDAHGLLDGAGHLRRIRDEFGQATFGDHLLAPPLRDEIGVPLVLGWQPLEGGDDALVLQQ